MVFVFITERLKPEEKGELIDPKRTRGSQLLGSVEVALQCILTAPANQKFFPRPLGRGIIYLAITREARESAPYRTATAGGT